MKNLCAISSPLSFNISLNKRLTADISSYLEFDWIHSPSMKKCVIHQDDLLNILDTHKTLWKTPFKKSIVIRLKFVDCLGHDFR